MPDTSTTTRRGELLRIAAELFASKGFKNTTVRDIADAAGILSGSLYHHFDSKESMIDEVLSTFQEELFGKYDAILAGSDDARTKLERAVRVSFEAIDQHPHEVAIFQNEADSLGAFDRFAYLAERDAQSRNVWMALLTRARSPVPCARPRRRAHLRLHPRHRVGRGRSYRPGGSSPRRRRRPVPPHPSRRDLSSGWLGRAEAYIVDAIRTPVGSDGGARRRPLGRLRRAHHPHRWSAQRRRPGAVDDVILGCCDTIGSQAGDIARTAWLVAGLPDHVPGVTIDRQCGSSQQAVHFAAQGVMCGTQDLVVAGGVQNMSAIPISAAMIVGQQYGFSDAVRRVSRAGRPGTATRRSASSARPR